MLYALAAFEPALRDSVRKAILMGPCTIPAEEQPGALEFWNSGLQVFEYSGPNWSVDKAKGCSIFSDEATCDDLDRFDDKQPTSLKSNAHWSQMALSKQFQTFQDNWSVDTKVESIDITQIKTIPISFYIAHFDEVCQPALSELTYAKLLTRSKYELFYDPSGHTLFETTNSFAENIVQEIEVNEGEAEALWL